MVEPKYRFSPVPDRKESGPRLAVHRKRRRWLGIFGPEVWGPIPGAFLLVKPGRMWLEFDSGALSEREANEILIDAKQSVNNARKEQE